VDVTVAEGVTGFLFLVDTALAVEAKLDKYFSLLMCPDTRAAVSEETYQFDVELWLGCVQLLCFLPTLCSLCFFFRATTSQPS